MPSISISLKALQKDESFKHYYTSPESPYDYGSSINEKESSSSSISRISPLILLVIIVLALIFFLYGIIHLVLWFLMKTPSSSSSSNRFPPETTRARGLQRQLHHLFRLHDSGLEQSLIDSLPVFHYENVVVVLGSKELPFDCAVCLCEFSEQDKLRLLPMCSHAFHINCIDTWLLSNSTCPLCRATISISSLSRSDLSKENQNPLHRFRGDEENNNNNNNVGCSSDCDQNGEKRVFSVRLGKFRKVNIGGIQDDDDDGEEESSNMNGRRCYSMGSYEYVVSGSDVKVVVSEMIGEKDDQEEVEEGKRIGDRRSRGESFSVSKIWLWSNKTKFHYSSNSAFP